MAKKRKPLPPLPVDSSHRTQQHRGWSYTLEIEEYRPVAVEREGKLLRFMGRSVCHLRQTSS